MKKQLHEAIQFPDDAFPYIMYTHTNYESIPNGRGVNDLHWHQELQITLVTKGKLTIQVNGINYALEAGQAIFINKSVLHIVTYLNQEGEYVSFNFPEKLLAFYSDSAMEKKYVLPYTNSFLLSLEIKGDKDWHNQILQILWDMKKEFESKKKWGWEYEVSIKTVQLWLILISNFSLSSEESSKYNRLQQERLQLMLSFIHKNYSNNLTLKEIADTAHLSVSECTRGFKKSIHMTPYFYLIKYRINKSCDLLIATDYTITEIAQRVGFNNANHFIQSFKKHLNITPKEFRKIRNERT
ncbi:AraC family transcriptional regulator [Paenibacillus odorifer]|uniref:AraC family transcriptional regulator n=1 Tax=Paenibacillus odorifer TaxID=189426 RepID=UPI00096F1C83|nr:AraC family transcriptional regulator [Paenibacillus odorifer]OMC73608.1 AraC family transcriptional regulator [Paenibacillus odorifer]OMD77596.1 AraC family transcriptional regulator [Paenibacillus odorifer]OME03728.1 AraC family transcriptional regulator [Paenibacillus odorifer]